MAFLSRPIARLPRYFVPGQPQHVILRGSNRQVIFAGEGDYQRAAMVRYPGDYRWSSHPGNAWGKNGFDYDWLVPHRLYEALSGGSLRVAGTPIGNGFGHDDGSRPQGNPGQHSQGLGIGGRAVARGDRTPG